MSEIALDDVEPGRRRRELALLHRKLGQLILQRLGRVDDRRLRAGLNRDELGAHVDALLQRRNQIHLRRDRLPQHVALGGLLRMLRLERSESRVELTEIGRQHPRFALPQRGWDVVWPVDRGDRRKCVRLRSCERRPATPRLGAGRGVIVSGGRDVGLGGRAVEFDEDVAGLHPVAVGDMDGCDLAGLRQLDDLDAARRLELALAVAGMMSIRPKQAQTSATTTMLQMIQRKAMWTGDAGVSRISRAGARNSRSDTASDRPRQKSKRTRSGRRFRGRGRGPARNGDADNLGQDASSIGRVCKSQR